jgi:hypothetical protein
MVATMAITVVTLCLVARRRLLKAGPDGRCLLRVQPQCLFHQRISSSVELSPAEWCTTW